MNYDMVMDKYLKWSLDPLCFLVGWINVSPWFVDNDDLSIPGSEVGSKLK